MNKLAFVLIALAFLLSQSPFYLLGFIPLALLVVVVPKTTPEKIGSKSKK